MTHQIRAVMAHLAFCGVPEWLLGELVTELAARWEARCESERHGRRQGSRRREAGAGPKYELVFTDRLLATLVHLRTGLTMRRWASSTRWASRRSAGRWQR
ncbi:hypothetical protein ACWD7C_41865 [Streptomyces sp. NPDC005134]|uniref:hypothetical protein n=1 Tax=unclassified Streptomyces TaxID=2593676 RepID=UPI00339EB2DA